MVTIAPTTNPQLIKGHETKEIILWQPSGRETQTAKQWVFNRRTSSGK
jgi:hypothetical protein